jgi:hypothetical protein
MKDTVNDLLPLDPNLSQSVQWESLLDYERLYQPALISRAILRLEGEGVLIRRPFRWTLDGEPINECQAYLGLEKVCELRGWKIVARYGDHIAIVSPSLSSGMSCLQRAGETGPNPT